jgi:small subunit ribosomal protein S20
MRLRADNLAGRVRSSRVSFPGAHRDPDEHQPTKPDRGIFVANIKSQLKRIKTNEKRHQRNKAVKSSLKTAIRRFREAADAGDTERAAELLRDASRKLDKAASKGVIHRNQAANRKSAIARRAAGI